MSNIFGPSGLKFANAFGVRMSNIFGPYGLKLANAFGVKNVEHLRPLSIHVRVYR